MSVLQALFVLLIFKSSAQVSGTAGVQTRICDLTVSTSQDVHHVADLLSEISPTLASGQDFSICLPSNHIFFLTDALRLNSSHNHPNGGRILWKGDNTTMSAGLPLRGPWYRCDDGLHCPFASWHGVWVHYVKDIVAPVGEKIGPLPFRNLWVKNTRVARMTATGAAFSLSTTPTGFLADASRVSSDWQKNQVELRWPSQIQNWIEPRCIVSAVSGGNITVAPGCWAELIKRNNGRLPPPPLFIENAGSAGAPPGAGEFFSTPDYIFYRPPADMPYQAPKDAFVPSAAEAILSGVGLINHTFTGITFAHGSWRAPSSASGYVPSQSLVTNVEPQGAVRFLGAQGLVVRKCTFRNIGKAYALEIGGASQNASVTQSTFEDLSGGGVKLGNVNDTRALTTNPAQMDSIMLLQDNLLRNVAVEFRGAACIFAGYVRRTNISHNTIENTGYTGISLGWGWGTHVKGPQTFASDNHIVFNRLVGVMSALNDGGCTYTLGPQPRSTVHGNYCQADRAPVVGCYYHDNGSRFFLTSNNVADTSPAPCVYLQGCCNSPAYDIAVRDLWCRATAPVRNGCAPQNCTIDNTTLHTLTADEVWPPAAQSIVNMAGARW